MLKEELNIDKNTEWSIALGHIRKILGEEKYQFALKKKNEIGQHLLVALNLQNILSFSSFREMIVENFSTENDIKLIKLDIEDIEVAKDRQENLSFYYLNKENKKEQIVPCWLPSLKLKNKTQAVLLYDDYQNLVGKTNTIKITKNRNKNIKNKITFTFKDIVKSAFEKDTSDVHIYYSGGYYNVAFRVAGELIDQPEFVMAQNIGLEFVKKVKIIASEFVKGEFNADQHFKAQDAKIEYPDIGLYGADIRLEFIPDGKLENITLIARILTRKKLSKANFEVLGYDKEIIDTMTSVSKKSNGLFISSGITGSGKSTLIANILLQIEDGKRIVTIEDPIEFQLNKKGLTQHQIYIPPEDDKKMGYLEYVKAWKRGDPDIISVGEMRNIPALTKAMMEMSASGQLIYTTLHITSAFGVYEDLSQIFNMNIDITRNLILFSINQVLVKKLCPYCKVKDEKYESISKLKEVRNELNYLYTEPLKDLFKNYKNLPLFYKKGGGCKHCGNSGYTGRTPVYEYLRPTVQFKEWLAKNKSTVTTNQVEKYACEAGIGKNKLTVFIDKLKKGVIDASDETLFKI